MKQLAHPAQAGLASRFSGKFQAVLNEVKAKSGLFLKYFNNFAIIVL
jgi:hypothetical protein